MAKCRICGYEERLTSTCLCGFCRECINKYGHDNCEKIVEDLIIEKHKKESTK